MQRFVGAVLILLATGSAGILYGIEQQCYLEKLLYIRHIVYMLKGDKYPVISISLKDVSSRTFDGAYSMLRSIIGNEAMRFPFQIGRAHV